MWVKRCLCSGKPAENYSMFLPPFAAVLEEVGGQAVLGRQNILPTPWLTERHGYDPTWAMLWEGSPFHGAPGE